MKIAQFENNLIEAHFEDGSKISWQECSILYFTNKGIKNTLSLGDISSSQELIEKLTKVVKICNIFNDQFIEWPYGLVQQDTQFKKYKAKQYRWSFESVKKVKDGYQITSQDLNATLKLRSDLYLVDITFLQLCSGKKITKSNMTKLLLEKYNFSYTQFPLQSQSSEINYQYRTVTKLFNIFNIHSRWYLPLHLLWNYILKNKYQIQSFCHIDFQGQQQTLKSTVMPCSRTLGTQNLNRHNHHNHQRGMPIWGKPLHQKKCNWGYSEKQNIVFWFGQVPLFYDNIGFWMFEGNSYIYKIKNHELIDKKYFRDAVPPTIRINKEKQRNIKQFLQVFVSYLKINLNKTKNNLIQNQPSQTNTLDIVSEIQLANIGMIRAYSNRMVVGKFIDKVMITLKNQDLHIVNENGQKLQTYLQSYANFTHKQYREHIKYVIEFHERTFAQGQWVERKLLQDDVKYYLKANQLFLQSCQRL